MKSVAEQLAAELGEPEPSPRNGAAGLSGDSPFARANAIEVQRVMSMLALVEGEHPKCPGCGTVGDTSVAYVGNGLKCLHDRCAEKGKGGFRTCVDLVAEARNETPRDAVNTLAGWFGFEGFASGSSEHTANGAVAEPEPEPEPLVSLATLLAPALDRAERRRTGEEQPVPVPFRELADTLGGGYWPGAHFIIAGTGVGKSQFSMQTGLAAAKAGIPVCYVGLELDEAQIALRVLGDHLGTRWSKLYLGRCTERDIADARAAAPALGELPFFVEFGPARGWPASRLTALAVSMRKQFPAGPLLIVLDYLQLVGSEPVQYQRTPDLRERIGGAAYAARDVARRFDATVLMISSAARNHYGLLAGDFATAGLSTRQVPGMFKPQKVILQPDVLIGLGKESGELEFSADTCTVLLRWPSKLDNGETAILAAVPKVRAGFPKWCALSFNGGRFGDLPIADLDDLPAPPKRTRRGGREPVTDDQIEKRVLAAATRNPGLSSRNKLAMATQGTRTAVLATIDRLVGDGRIEFDRDGVVVRLESEPTNS